MYAGTTSQNEKVTFEVPAGGTSIKDFRLSDLNMSCQPPNLVSVNAPGLTLAETPVAVNADSTFSIGVSDSGVIEGYPYTDNIKVTGKFSGTTASGTYEENFSIDLGFIVIACTAPGVTWNASHT